MKKQKHVLLVLIQGVQSSRIYSVANGEPLKASPDKCSPWLGRRSHYDKVFASSRIVSHSCTWARFTKSSALNAPKVSHTAIPLPMLFFLPAMAIPTSHLPADACSKVSVLSLFFHPLAWSRCPSHCHMFSSVKALIRLYYSLGGHCLHCSWTLSSLGAHSSLNLQCSVTSTASDPMCIVGAQ